MKKLKIEEIRTNAENRGYKILSEKYVNNTTNLVFLHKSCKYEFEETWINFSHTKEPCPRCSIDIFSFDLCLYLAYTRGYKILKEISRKNDTCTFKHLECGKIFDMVWSSFEKFSGCPNCTGRRRIFDYEECVDIAQKRGYEILSDSYERTKSKMKFRHISCGSVFDMTWDSFMDERGCRGCRSSSIGEKEVRKCLIGFGMEEGTDFVCEKRFSDCRYKLPLPFDFYIPSINVCIEYQGEHHYFPVNYNGSSDADAEMKFKEMAIKDKIKNKYCESNGITLIKIPFWEFKVVENILLDKLSKIMYHQNK